MRQPAHPVIRHTRTRQAWTTREESYLREHYRTMDVATLAARLRRTERSITNKVTALGLHKRVFAAQYCITGEFYRVGRVADGLGVDEGRVRAWIAAGQLTLHAHWIAGADLAAFLRRWPDAVDWQRMTAEQRRWARALMDDETATQTAAR